MPTVDWPLIQTVNDRRRRAPISSCLRRTCQRKSDARTVSEGDLTRLVPRAGRLLHVGCRSLDDRAKADWGAEKPRDAFWGEGHRTGLRGLGAWEGESSASLAAELPGRHVGPWRAESLQGTSHPNDIHVGSSRAVTWESLTCKCHVFPSCLGAKATCL